MSNTKTFAEEEFKILLEQAKEAGDTAIVEPFIPEMLSLIDKVGESGQSGGSIHYTVGAIIATLKNLLLKEPITPITGKDEEWVNVSDQGDGSILYQNKRCSTLFKDSNDKCWYLDSIRWVTEEGHGWTGSAWETKGAYLASKEVDGNSSGLILDHHYVKSFPFWPKTFTIAVTEEEVSKDNWEFYIKDLSQLDEVFEYYNKKEYNV